MIKINLEKINASLSLDEYFEESPESYEKLRNHVLYFEESSILISGYRGVGKTTMIRMLEDAITTSKIVSGNRTGKNNPEKSLTEEKTVLCIHMNMDRYDTYPNFIRNLSRELFISYKKTIKDTSVDDQRLLRQLELLYQQTFYQVNEISNIEKTVEREAALSLSLNAGTFIKKLIPLLVIVFGSFLSAFKFNILGIVTAIIGLIWLFVDNADFTRKRSKKNIEKKNVSVESFYDSEIAEYRFFDMLNKLQENNFKVVLIFDEIDKIDKEEKLDKTLAEIKKIILHQGTNSILIAGQRLLYKLISAGVTDDGLLSSMFSATLHVPMLESNDLREKLYKYFIVERLEKKNRILLNKYIDSVILKSNSVLRQARHEIISDIEFVDNEPYINLSDQKISEIELDSSLLGKINEIVTNQPYFKKKEGKEDLVRYHLFIWINRMKQYKYTDFSSLEIYDKQKINEENYPRISLIEMDSIFPILLNSLVKAEIIEKMVTEDDELEDKEEIRYSWIKNSISMSEDKNTAGEDISGLYIQAKEELMFYNNFSNDFFDYYLEESSNNIDINLLKDFNKKVFDNIKPSKDELANIQSLLRKNRGVKFSLLESYTNFILSHTLKNRGFEKYDINKYEDLNINPDIVYSSRHTDLLVEVKGYGRPQFTNNVMNQIFFYLNRWEKLLKDNGDMKNFVAVLVIYDISTRYKNREDDYSSLQNKWINRFNSTFPEYKDKFFVILMPMINDNLLEKRILDIVEASRFDY